MPTVHLIDALPYVFRAYFSLPSSIQDREGRPVQAVRGFADFLVRYLTEEQPTHLACLFDESLVTSFRNEFYAEYKAQRELPPPELEQQLDACQSLARAFGVPTWSDNRYEADDLIATLAHRLGADGHSIVVVSSDKDLAQLVSERVEFFDFARDERFGPAQVRERWGVEPGQIVDWIALAGDSVDNIPGVPRVGPKTAVALLEVFRDIDDLYGRLDEVAELPIRGAKSLGKRLAEHEDLARLSHKLGTLAIDAPVTAELNDLCWEGARRDELRALVEELDFSHVEARVPLWKD